MLGTKQQRMPTLIDSQAETLCLIGKINIISWIYSHREVVPRGVGKTKHKSLARIFLPSTFRIQ